ncbi:hypothetical protein D3C87_1606060 [compost metagenome]
MKYPAPTTVNSTRPTARVRIGPRKCQNSRLGMRQPSENNSGGRNRNRNSSGSRATCRPRVGQASKAPAAICTNGNGSGTTRPIRRETPTSINRIRTV